MKAAKRLEGIKEYYFSQKLREVKALEAKGVHMLNLGIGSPDMSPPESVINQLAKTAFFGQANGYQGYKGTEGLRESMADWMQRFYGVSMAPHSEILPLMGSKEGITHICQAFLNPDDEVLIPNPGYPTYASAASIAGAHCHYYTVSQGTGIHLDEIKKTLTPKTKIVWINMPHMPTGEQPNRAQLQSLVDLAKSEGFLIVNDNPYSTILTDDYFSIFQLKDAKDVCLELNSLSKTFNMAGWRVGWLSGKQSLIDIVLLVKSNVDSGMYWPIQQASKIALRESISWMHEMNEEYRIRREKVWELLHLLRCTYDKNSVGMFVWAKVPDNCNNGEELSDTLLYHHGIFVPPGIIFGSNGDRFIRVSLCINIEDIQVAIQRISNHLKTQHHEHIELVPSAQ